MIGYFQAHVNPYINIIYNHNKISAHNIFKKPQVKIDQLIFIERSLPAKVSLISIYLIVWLNDRF